MTKCARRARLAHRSARRGRQSRRSRPRRRPPRRVRAPPPPQRLADLDDAARQRVRARHGALARRAISARPSRNTAVEAARIGRGGNSRSSVSLKGSAAARPARAVAREAHAVVQPERAVGPKFDLDRGQAGSRANSGGRGISCRRTAPHNRRRAVQAKRASRSARLPARPGADLRPAGAERK